MPFDSSLESLFLKIDRISAADYYLRKIEQKGGTEQELRLQATTMYDLLFSFMNQFCMISQIRPEIRRFKDRFSSHLPIVQERLYLNLDPAPSDVDVKAIAAFINVRAEILVAALNSIKGDMRLSFRRGRYRYIISDYVIVVIRLTRLNIRKGYPNAGWICPTTFLLYSHLVFSQYSESPSW